MVPPPVTELPFIRTELRDGIPGGVVNRAGAEIWHPQPPLIAQLCGYGIDCRIYDTSNGLMWAPSAGFNVADEIFAADDTPRRGLRQNHVPEVSPLRRNYPPGVDTPHPPLDPNVDYIEPDIDFRNSSLETGVLDEDTLRISAEEEAEWVAVPDPFQLYNGTEEEQYLPRVRSRLLQQCLIQGHLRYINNRPRPVDLPPSESDEETSEEKSEEARLESARRFFSQSFRGPLPLFYRESQNRPQSPTHESSPRPSQEPRSPTHEPSLRPSQEPGTSRHLTTGFPELTSTLTYTTNRNSHTQDTANDMDDMVGMGGNEGIDSTDDNEDMNGIDGTNDTDDNNDIVDEEELNLEQELLSTRAADLDTASLELGKEQHENQALMVYHLLPRHSEMRTPTVDSASRASHPISPNGKQALLSTVSRAYALGDAVARNGTGCRKRIENLKKQVGIGKPNDDGSPQSMSCVIIGFSAHKMEYVSAAKRNAYKPAQSHDRDRDNLKSIELKGVRGNAVVGQGVIFLESFLVPGALSTVVKALWEEEYDESGVTQSDFDTHHIELLNGSGSEGPFQSLSNAGRVKFGKYGRAHEYSDLHPCINWPPMAALDIPPAMIAHVREFLRKHPNDHVPMNIAIAAIIIYVDLRAQEDYGLEGWVTLKGKPPGAKAVPVPSMEVFVLYFPHLLRFVETSFLTAFPHPMRWAKTIYDADNATGHEEFVIHENCLNADMINEWVKNLVSKCEGFPADMRIPLIPASMPGSKMRFPRGTVTGRAPSEATHALCLLNDVRTLGRPDYRYRPQVICKLGMPVSWAQNWAPEREEVRLETFSVTPQRAYWDSRSPTAVMALTGDTSFIGTVWLDMKTIAEGPGEFEIQAINLTKMTDRPMRDLEVLSHMRRYMPGEWAGLIERQVNFSLEAARQVGASVNSLEYDRQTFSLGWEGKALDWDRLAENGTLKRLREEIEINGGKAKRAKSDHEQPQRKLLNKGFVEETLAKIKALINRAQDWSRLEEYLEADESPTYHTLGKMSDELEKNVFSYATEHLRPEEDKPYTGSLRRFLKVMLLVTGRISSEEYKLGGYDLSKKLTENEDDRRDQVNKSFASIGQLRRSDLAADLKDRCIRPFTETLAKQECVARQMKLHQSIKDFLGGDTDEA